MKNAYKTALLAIALPLSASAEETQQYEIPEGSIGLWSIENASFEGITVEHVPLSNRDRRRQSGATHTTFNTTHIKLEGCNTTDLEQDPCANPYGLSEAWQNNTDCSALPSNSRSLVESLAKLGIAVRFEGDGEAKLNGALKEAQAACESGL